MTVVGWAPQSRQILWAEALAEERARGLDIKNEEAQRLARQLVELTGENMSQAVTVALRERLERVRKPEAKASVEQLLAIGRRCAAHLREPADALDHDQLLYDERGLPK